MRPRRAVGRAFFVGPVAPIPCDAGAAVTPVDLAAAEVVKKGFFKLMVENERLRAELVRLRRPQ